MLWNSKHDLPKDKLTLESFVAWLERQNPNERYNWNLPDRCPAGRYRTEVIGRQNLSLGSLFEFPNYNFPVCCLDFTTWPYHYITANLTQESVGKGIFDEEGWTYGEAAKRGRKCLEKEAAMKEMEYVVE